MPPEIDQIQIKEPTFQELGKKTSCLKRSCMAGGTIAIILVLGLSAAYRHLSKPRIQHVASIPANFPTSIPLYDKKNIDDIVVVSGHNQGIIGKSLSGVLGDRVMRLLNDQQETVTVEWSDLPAKPKFLMDYYTNALQKQGFSIALAQDADAFHEIDFATTTFTGVITIRDSGRTDGTDVVTLSVQIPSADTP